MAVMGYLNVDNGIAIRLILWMLFATMLFYHDLVVSLSGIWGRS